MGERECERTVGEVGDVEGSRGAQHGGTTGHRRGNKATKPTVDSKPERGCDGVHSTPWTHIVVEKQALSHPRPAWGTSRIDTVSGRVETIAALIVIWKRLE
jgi:hypothetical protein